MLSAADADLARRDTDLPGLALLLDPDAFMAALRAQIADAEVNGATITYMRYKPRTSCLVAYQLETPAGRLDVYATTHRPSAWEKIAKAQRRDVVHGPLGRGRIVFQDRATVVSIFPNDSKVKGLPSLVDDHARSHLLGKLLPRRPELWNSAVIGLRYKPERRYVAQLRVGDEILALLKVYTASGFATAVRNADAFRSVPALRLPKKIGRSRRHAMLALEWLPGSALNETIAAGREAVEGVARAGEAIALLHRQRGEALSAQVREFELARLHALSETLAFIRPSLAGRATDLTRALTAHLRQSPALTQPIHGDFYAKQVILADDAVGILDLDEAVLGDPAADLGMFIAHLELDGLRGSLPRNNLGRLRDAFIEGYRTTIAEPLPPRIDVYTALGMLRLAPHPFRQRERAWPELMEALLDRAAAMLPGEVQRVGRADTTQTLPRGISQSTVSCEVIDPFGVTDDPAMPWLEQALSPHEVQHELVDTLAGLTGGRGTLQLHGIRVVRYKAGQRCLIEYEVDVERPPSPAARITLVGKSRARGLDLAGYAVLVALWNGGFRADSPDGISVPEPIAVIPAFQLWLSRKAPGMAATRLLGEEGGVALAGRIADAIHKLHRAGVSAQRRHTMADELQILRERLGLVARMKPEWAKRLDRLLGACSRLAAATPSSGPAGIHRDFYADHVLVDGSRLYLVDFDLYCEGDPALDAGNFLGHLTEQGLRTLGNPQVFADQERVMEDRFVELSGPASRVGVRAYRLLTLARHISLSTQFEDRRPFTEALLDWCEAQLAAYNDSRTGRTIHKTTSAKG